MNALRIVYLEHSGFAVEAAETLLVFDYYRDPANRLAPLIAAAKRCWFFSSHAHGDHFNREIGRWNEVANGYVLSSDIRPAGLADSAKIISCRPYQQVALEEIAVRTFGSTDAGVSFYVEVNGWRIFHAGDLNRWHWTGDTPEARRQADADWQRELQRLSGITADVAFFPLDQRLGEEYRAAGAREFCNAIPVGKLIAMHSNGEPWQAPADFPAAVWSPGQAGEELILKK